VTSYTKYRKYPYPSSEREVANGAVHSEALARAVALDLDTLDAGWAAAPIRTSKILTLTTNGTAVAASSVFIVQQFGTVSSTKGSAGLVSDGTGVRIADATAEGWYYANLNAELGITGAVTIPATFDVMIQHLKLSGSGALVEPTANGERIGNVFTSSSSITLDNRASGIFRLTVNDRLWVRWKHGNAASTARINQSLSVFEVVRLSPL
jgi:hypothetical protein